MLIIYKTTNLINGKIYIGQTSKNNPNYLGSGKILNNAIKKYGRENFKREVIEECIDKEELDLAEIFWITNYQSTNKNIGYNITNGGGGGDTFTNNPNKEEILKKNHREPWNKGLTKDTDERVKKYGEKGGKTQTGKHMSDEFKRGCSLRSKGNHYSLGIKRTPEEKKARSDTLKGRPSPMRKAVLQFDLNNNFIAEYSSITLAEKETGCKNRKISNCCKNKINDVNGFIWKFKNK